MALSWYVAQTKPQSEAIADKELANQAFTTYLPRVTVRRKVVGRMSEVLEPLFRGYIFVALDLAADHWKAVNSTRGVLALLPRPAEPQSIAASEIDGLKELEGQGLFKTGAVKPGEKVRVWRGSLADHVLECIEDRGARIRCLWACFGAPRVVDVALSDVTVSR